VYVNYEHTTSLHHDDKLNYYSCNALLNTNNCDHCKHKDGNRSQEWLMITILYSWVYN